MNSDGYLGDKFGKVRWVGAGREVGSDEGGQHTGGLLGTSVSP